MHSVDASLQKKILSHLFWTNASFTSHVDSMFWWRRGSHHMACSKTYYTRFVSSSTAVIEKQLSWDGYGLRWNETYMGGEGGESHRTPSTCSFHALWPIWNWITDPIFVKFCRVTTVHVCNSKLLSIFFSLKKQARCSAICAVHDNYWHNWPRYI